MLYDTRKPEHWKEGNMSVNEENARYIRAAIFSAIKQAQAEQGGLDRAVEIARASIDALDQRQGVITLEAPGALRRAVEQAWG
jgi:hypothetical protein